ncbi:MAG: acireductone synthase [Persicimonas sp.]
MTDSSDYKAVLLDIEGTVTPIEFVYEVLFPYAQRELQSYLERHWNNPEVRRDIDQIVDHIAQSARTGDHDLPALVDRDQTNIEAFRSAVIEHITWQMENDQKLTPLKRLQGRMWRDGYQRGELVAPVFDDVPRAFERWNEAGLPIYIYSSGSVEAQKLLFEHTNHGDLLDYLSGYFDTTTGHKKESDSYAKIATEVDCAPGKILFVTDNLEEARAARTASMQVAISQRPGNPTLPDHDFPVIESFDPLLEGL